MKWEWGIAASRSEGGQNLPNPVAPGLGISLRPAIKCWGPEPSHQASARGGEPFALSEKPALR